jgi:raffinose/stachyose/melibiose transport system substrate-binding protein
MQNTVTNTPGKTYAVSYEAIYSGVWYNKNIFQQYNLSVPKDWDDFLSICKSLKSNGVTPLVQGGKDLWPIDEDKSLPLYALYDSNKGFKADLYSGTVKWTDPDVGAQFARLGQLLDPKNGYYVSGMLGTTYAQCYQLMLQHKAAMWIMGSWATETMTQSSVKPDFEMGFFPLPNNDAGQTQHSYGQLAARPYGIYAKSKNVNNALSFLEFMSEPANMSIQAKETEVIPTVKDATAVSVPAWSDLQNLMKLPLGGEANQDMSSGHAIGANVQQIWWSELDKVAAGSETMDQYLQALQAAQTKDSATK